MLLNEGYRGEVEPGQHAEYGVLEKKLEKVTLVDATVYTTLEPCTTRNHPKVPCAERLLERRVARVWIGMLDPNPEIRGAGFRLLVDRQVEVRMFPPDLMSRVEEINRAFTRAQPTRVHPREGATSVKPSKAERQREHDIAVFRAAEAVLNENDLDRFLDWLLTSDDYYRSAWTKVDDYRRFLARPGNEFVSTALRKQATAVGTAIARLGEFLTKHFFQVSGAQEGDQRYWLDPTGNVDRGGNFARAHEYEALSKAMCERAWAVETTWKRLRRAIKQELAV